MVAGQHLMQAQSDIFLGWTHILAPDGVERDFYVRQLRDWKFSVPIEVMPGGHDGVLPALRVDPARAHARSGDRIALAAYLGGSAKFDHAIADFAETYADQNELDYAAFQAAVKDGRVEAVPKSTAGLNSLARTDRCFAPPVRCRVPVAAWLARSGLTGLVGSGTLRSVAHVELGNEMPGIRGLLAYRPETAGPLMELAQVLLRGDSTLSAGERELIAASVSRQNECEYCRGRTGRARPRCCPAAPSRSRRCWPGPPVTRRCRGRCGRCSTSPGWSGWTGGWC